MRMWMILPHHLCRNHLLGEHYEIHKFVGAILKGQLENGRLHGYINGGYLEVNNLRTRHSALVKEMKARGYKHNSPLPKFPLIDIGIVDIDRSYRELINRCKKCRTRMK